MNEFKLALVFLLEIETHASNVCQVYRSTFLMQIFCHFFSTKKLITLLRPSVFL